MSKAKKARCPVCGRDTMEKYSPFCSKRCADVDLGHWFQGTYVIESDEEFSGEDVAEEEE